MKPVRLAVMGAGLIGRRHAEIIAAEPAASLAGIIDPSPAAAQVAASLCAPLFPDFDAMLRAAPPEGVVIATPNQLHVAHGLKAVTAGIPAVIEKPVADDLAEAERLVDAAEQAGVVLLAGNHRRYNPMIAAARAVIGSGRLGTIVAVHGSFWLLKPDGYFDAAWRRETGAGPVFLNLIHDIDLMRHLCGEIVAVQAQDSNAARGFAVEDSAVIILRFASGALGTITVSDSIAAPWSWEMTAGENPAYPRQEQSCYLIGGTAGSLALPQLEVWSYPGARGWFEPLSRERVPFAPADPLVEQIRHFCAVIRGWAEPLMPAREGLRTLKVVAAVKHAARTGMLVRV